MPIRAGSSRPCEVMVEQVKSIDFRARTVKRIGHAPESVLHEVLSLLDACIY